MILDIPAFMAAYRAARHASPSAANASYTAYNFPQPASTPWPSPSLIIYKSPSTFLLISKESPISVNL
jgi:hypothetical protein